MKLIYVTSSTRQIYATKAWYTLSVSTACEHGCPKWAVDMPHEHGHQKMTREHRCPKWCLCPWPENTGVIFFDNRPWPTGRGHGTWIVCNELNTNMDDHSWCVTSHPEQCCLLPPVGWKINTGQAASQGAMAVLFWQKSNHRSNSSVALAMHHRLCGLSSYGLNGLRMGDMLYFSTYGEWYPLPCKIIIHNL